MSKEAGLGSQLSLALITQSQPEFLLEILPTELQEQLWGVTTPGESTGAPVVIATKVTSQGDTNTPELLLSPALSPQWGLEMLLSLLPALIPRMGGKILIKPGKNPDKTW